MSVANDLPGSVVVSFPPPPARVEVLPAPPADSSCVWVDGQWTYKNEDFEWVPGAWVKSNAGCAFAKSRLWWDETGTGTPRLRYRSGRWVVPVPPFTECPTPVVCTVTGF